MRNAYCIHFNVSAANLPEEVKNSDKNPNTGKEEKGKEKNKVKQRPIQPMM
jgi:hypothetical protein